MKPLPLSIAKRCIVVSLISIGLISSVFAEPIKGSLIPNCPVGGYSVYFVNGVDNQFTTASMSMRALSVLAIPKAFDQDIINRMTVDVIYNPTDSRGMDLFEAIRQLGTGLVSNVSAYFTGAFVSVLGLLAPLVPSFDGVLTRFIEAFRVSVTRPLSTAGIQKVIRDNVPRIVKEINQGKIVILVGHSQGNLFVNEIYDEVKLIVPANKIGLLQVVHAASPSSRHLGKFIMNSSDFINSLTYGPATYTSSTLKNYILPIDHNEKVFLDILGHSFISTYLSRVPGVDGGTLQDQMVSSLQAAFNSGMTAALESCPSNGGFNQVSLSCKRDETGSATITGLYSADLLPGEQITPVGWSVEYLTQPPGNGCISPTYTFPDNRRFGIPGQNILSYCTPTTGLRLQPESYASCHNPLDGQPRTIWVSMAGQVTSELLNTGSVYVQFCRATTINLNGKIPPNPRPPVSIQSVVACN